MREWETYKFGDFTEINPRINLKPEVFSNIAEEPCQSTDWFRNMAKEPRQTTDWFTEYQEKVVEDAWQGLKDFKLMQTKPGTCTPQKNNWKLGSYTVFF